MADLVQTPASVVGSSGASYSTGTAGATILAGQPVYLDATDSKLKLADANASLATATVVGIASHPSAANQPLTYQTAGDINLGATLTVAKTYHLSGTAGAIAPSEDLVTGWRNVILGFAISATILRMALHNTGIAVP